MPDLDYRDINRSITQLLHAIDATDDDGITKIKLLQAINKSEIINVVNLSTTFEALSSGIFYVPPTVSLTYTQRIYFDVENGTSYIDQQYQMSGDLIVIKSSYTQIVVISTGNVRRFYRRASNVYSDDSLTNKQNQLVEGSGIKLERRYDGKTEISIIGGGGGGGTVDTTMSDSSENAVQNKVIKSYVDNAIDTEINAALADIIGEVNANE